MLCLYPGRCVVTGLEYIRQHYNVPARIGGRIVYNGHAGVIRGDSAGQYLLAELDNYPEPVILHPTWNVSYLDDIEVPA